MASASLIVPLEPRTSSPNRGSTTFTDVGIRKDGDEWTSGVRAQAVGGSSDETVSCSVSNLLYPSG
jgi:hypothetical protein